MRIALFLLFLLALASVPGSIFPQRGTAPAKVSQYLREHPKTGMLLDRLNHTLQLLVLLSTPKCKLEFLLQLLIL
jgi:cytochrome c biogenesis protein ResB